MSNALKDIGFSDLERELTVTRRVLERLPNDKFAWRAHEKSMTMGELSQHVVNLVAWMVGTLDDDVLDLATTPPMKRVATGCDEALAGFDANVAKLRESWARTDDARLTATWTVKHGDEVIVARPRGATLRVWCLSHLVHHRAQLCVMLRVHGVPVPTVYFNSADEPEWKFD